MNLLETRKRFSSKKKCISFLERARWGVTPICTYCGSSKHTARSKEFRYQCNSCNRSYSVTIGTIFHNSKLSLPKWFIAIVLILNAKKGISSRQLARDLGVDKNTAWYLQMRVRLAMSEDPGLLDGLLEVDETYIHGIDKTFKDHQIINHTQDEYVR